MGKNTSQIIIVFILKELLGYDISEINWYLISLNKHRILRVTKLSDITTSQDQPLEFEHFSCWIQCENVTTYQKFCHPTITVVKIIENCQLDLSNAVAFHNRKRVPAHVEI